MKKAVLIVTGSVAGLGAVLTITPPQFGTPNAVIDLGAGALPTQAPTAAASTPTASAAPTSTSSATAKPSSTATTKPKPGATATATAAPTQKATPTAAPVTGASGTFQGDGFRANQYGTVQVSATFSNGKITSVSASQSPRSWSQQSFSVIVPYVNAGSITIEQVKQFSAAQLPCSTSNSCNSRASYSATAFWESLKSAISKAGL